MKWAAPFAVLLAVLLVAGCGKGNFSEQASAGKKNVFRYPIPELTKLDPAMVQDGDTIDALQQVYEGLTTWGEDSKVKPNLAESWDVSPDGKTYTFHIRKGVKFHNGREVTADDFKYTLERVADPKLQSPTVTTYLYMIVGVMDKYRGKATSVSGVQVVDKYTLKIVIDAPRPYFLGDLTYPASFVVCKEALNNGAEITDVKQMVGTGPYMGESFVPNQVLTLKANKEYRSGAPAIDGIERPIIKDAVARLNKFKSGEVDLTRIERADVVTLQNDPKYKDQVHLYDRPSVYYVGLNVGTFPPFKNLLVRRAIAMAIDKEKICRETLGGINKVAHSIIPPGVLGHRDNAKDIAFDPAQARQLLAQAGFPGGKGFPSATLTHRDGQPDVRLVADAIVTDLRKNLGIEVGTSPLPWTTYLDKHNKKTLDFFHMRWAADYLDPQDFLSTLLATYGSENRQNYSNPSFDALCTRADTMVGDDAQRMSLYAQAEDLVLQDSPFIPIYFEKEAQLISPRVTGLRDSLFGHLPHTTVKLTQ